MWEGFGVLFGINLVGAIFIAVRRDIVWTVGAAWLAASVWKQSPKSAPVSVSSYIFVFHGAPKLFECWFLLILGLDNCDYLHVPASCRVSNLGHVGNILEKEARGSNSTSTRPGVASAYCSSLM